MKSFTIGETLIFNPTLVSSKKKPIESDIQQAKIVAYHPDSAPIQQKCNTVGMAEGVYEFCRSLQTDQQKSVSSNQLFVTMDNCCLVSKQVEEKTWIFLRLVYDGIQGNFTKYNEDEQNTYIDSMITQNVAMNVLNHFYMSFRTFYGPINAFIFSKRQQTLQKILSRFVPTYEQINKIEQSKRLDISSYIIPSIRSLPLDVNSTLKFGYFKNVLQSYDSNISQIMIFSHGLLAYSTLQKDSTEFFLNYFYGTGEPYNFDLGICNRKLKDIGSLEQFTEDNKYGTFFNSLGFGLGNIDNSIADSRISGLRREPSQSRVSVQPQVQQTQSESFDLLGLSESQRLAFPEVYITKNGVEQKYLMTCFFEKKMLFVTFFKNITSKDQIIFQNRFYFDNISKFSLKISQLLNGILAQTDNYRFLYSNLNTIMGKSSIQKWNVFVPQVRYVWQTLQQNKQAQLATTIQNHWVYGIHRLNRVLILLIPNQIPLHKLDDFAEKMYKQYFFKAYM